MYDMNSDMELKGRIVDQSLFVDKWRDEVVSIMSKANPSWDKDDIIDELNDYLKEEIQIPKVTLDNNYTGERKDTNLFSVFDWAIKRKPLVAGNGTFYKNQHEEPNPTALMIDGFLAERKRLKKEMFKIEDVTSDAYRDLDRAQLNEKILANSYYGASGMKLSAFYSRWSGPATTGTAQSVISTTETLFEGFLVDNYQFIDINECFHFMETILDDDYKLEDYIIRVNKHDLIERLKNMFIEDSYKEEYNELLESYISSLSIDEVTKIYYKYNLLEFTRRHESVKILFDKLFTNIENLQYAEKVDDIPINYLHLFEGSDKERVKAYNKFVNNQYFMDPNNPPDTIKDTLEEINNIYMKYVYHPFMSIDRIFRLKFFKRKTVCIVDTDSNILALDKWVEFCNNELLTGDYGRSEENNTFIMINALAYFITSAVGDTLNEYGKKSNIPDDYRGRFNMKNEFYFNKLLIGRKKKRYISSIKLREGNLIEPYKPDVKGFEYAKATTSEYAKERFDSIVKKHILESKLPDIVGILQELQNFEMDIRKSIESGETIYLPLANAKDIAAYKQPYSQQGFRGTVAWNTVYPDRQISVPSKVSLLKLNIFTLDDMDDLRNTHPEVYNKIRKGIFESPIEDLAKKGLQVIAIPGNEQIPDWCLPYIDYNTVVNNILGQFKGVLDVFGIDCPQVGKSIKGVNRKTKRFSNIVRF